ncbi:snRNA-activating protein complex subunit 4 isoform X2 [Heterodontus francisci]
MTQRQLLGNRFDDHDWIKIANIDFDGSRKAEDIKNLWQNSEHPSISKAQWSNEEMEKLIEFAEQNGCVDWEWIASKLQTNRTAFMCLQKYQELNKELRKKEWTEEEDQMLTELVHKMRVGSFIPYTKIAYFMEGRNGSQLLYRWSKTLDPTLKRGPWTPAEDELLLKAVAKYGTRDWFKIQEDVPGRIDAQCRGRFLNTLNRNVRRGKWLPEEERDFRALIEKHGVGKWSKIAAEMAGRTETQCLSKWKIISGIKAKERAQAKPRQKRRCRRITRKRRESSSESSEFSSEDVKFMEETEDEQEEEENPEEAQELERKKRRMSYRNLAESIVLDVDRWVPVVEKEPAAPEKSENCRGGNTASVKSEGQNLLGRPRSSKIWKSFSHPASAVPNASEPDKSLREKEPAAQSEAPDPGAPPEIAPCLAVDEVPLKPPRARREPKKSIRQVRAADLEKKLIAQMCRWTAAKILNRREVDLLCERLEATGLSSTPVFTLLIQVFRIDKDGCMQIIKDEMNKEAQSLSENEQVGEKLRQGSYLQQVKDSTISVGNGQTMEITRFKLGPAPPRQKPKTVLELLAEKRSATSSASATMSQPVVVLAQPAASPSKASVGPVLQVAELTRPASPLQIRVSRRRAKPGSRSSVRRAVRGESVPSVPTQALTSGQHPASDGPGAAPQTSPIQPPAAGKVMRNLQLSVPSTTITAPLKPDTTNAQRRLQPIAPAPAAPPTVQPNNVVVPLMLANSNVPIMAVLTPQGLLYVPPGSLTALPNPSIQSPAPIATASQAAPCSSHQVDVVVSSTVPSCNTETVTTAVQAAAGCPPAGSQVAADSHVVIPKQTTSGAKPAPAQPLASPSPVIHQTRTTVPPASTLTAGLLALGHVQQTAANSIDSNVSAHVNQDGGSRPSVGLPEAGCSDASPSSLAQHEGTEPPATRSQLDKASVDFKLLSDEQEAVMKDWLQGNGGVWVPGMPTSLPYLPPSSSTLRAFSNLLLHKKVLEQSLSGFVLPEGTDKTDPKKGLEAARSLVADRLQNNPAYQLLKARFLSAFTLPAFLATMPPQGTRTTVGPSTGALDHDSEEGSEDTDTDEESDNSIEEPPAQFAVDEVANRELNQPFEVSFADLSFGCNLPGSLETIGDQTAPEQPTAPKSETEVLTRRSLRLRKKL